MTRVVVLFVLAAVLSFGMSIKEVNKASKEELIQIKGVGEKKADAIIQYRKKSSFKSFEDLENVKGVGPALAKNIKNDVHKKEPKAKSSKKKSTSSKETKSKTSKKKSASK